MKQQTHLQVRVAKDGTWCANGQEVINTAVKKLFFENLRRDNEGYFLQLWHKRIPVEVEDTPFLAETVRELTSENGGIAEFIAYLNDGTRETVQCETIRLGPKNEVYLRVKNSRFEARASISSAYTILKHAEEKNGTFYLRLHDRKIPVPQPGGTPFPFI